jgi:hypothetical protein
MDSYILVADLNTKVSNQYRLIEWIDIEGREPRRRDSRIRSRTACGGAEQVRSRATQVL